MKKTWQVQVNEAEHIIEYKSGLTGDKIIVNGQSFRVRSQNYFLRMIDYPIQIGGTELRVVVIGNKADLAVNGKYQGTGEDYVPLHKIPTLSYVFVGLSCIGGYFVCGIIGVTIGLLFSTLGYIRLGEKGKTGLLIAAFAGCTVVQVLVMFLLAGLLISTGYYSYL